MRAGGTAKNLYSHRFYDAKKWVALE